MREIVLDGGYANAFHSWRNAARVLLQQHVSPDNLCWRVSCDTQSMMFAEQVSPFEINSPCVPLPSHGKADARVPREFIRIAESVACHSDSTRWDALYRVLYRLTHGESSLMDVATDPDVHQLTAMNKAVRRDVHKMHAFVRFRAVESENDAHIDVRENTAGEPVTNTSRHSAISTSYVAWFEPRHHIVQRATPFFARRFASMRWSILTPAECAHWNGSELQFSPGVSRAMAPSEDELEELWRSYYSHIFNPARVATGTMQAEMPQRYWNNLPEAQLIASLTRNAPLRVLKMMQQLDEAPEDIPEDLRSRIGDVTEPVRTREIVPQRLLMDLDTPGDWDPVHDPGVTTARARLMPSGNSSELVASNTDRMPAMLRSEGAGNDTEYFDDSNATLQTPSLSVAELNNVALHIGTASWTDPTLLQRGVFYPDEVNTPEARLRYYASQFSLVEVDSTYYVPPTRAMAAAWAERTPDDFVFDIKAFALMTGHAAETKRLPDWLRRALPRSMAGNERIYAKDLPTKVVDDVWQRFQHALTPLRDAGKLGPILLQFPRWFAPTRESADALRTARERLGESCAAVEFRNPDWVRGRMAARTVSLLESLNFTYVVVDAPPGTASSMPPFAPITTPDLCVVRLHGRRTETWEARNAVVSERYRYLYDNNQLNEWSHRIDNIAEQMRQLKTQFPDMAKARQGVHVVFNNCHANYGTTNAIEITKTLIEFDKVRRRGFSVI